MDWNSEKYRGSVLIELLELHSVDPNAMLDHLYDLLIDKGPEILDNGNSPEDIRQGMDTIIKWFSDNEKYEQCHKLKQIKETCIK